MRILIADDDPVGRTRVEAYVSRYANVQFSHGICSECYERVMAEEVRPPSRGPAPAGATRPIPGPAYDEGLWTLPEPWTHRTRPPLLGKPQTGLPQAPTGQPSFL